MSKLQEIKHHIHSLIPELLELSFGCVISYEQSGYKHRKRTILAKLNRAGRGQRYLVWEYTAPHDLHPADDGILKTCNHVYKDEIYENFGKKIELHHVLRAIGILNVAVYKNGKSHPHNLCMTTNGFMLNENNMHLFDWDLNKNTLDEQSKFVINWLHDLFFKK